MKMMKRIILAGIALVLLLSIGAYIAIKLAFPPTKIKELINKHGTEALNREVTVEDISIHIFPNLKLSVREVNVANAQGFSSDPCIKLRELALSIDFVSLLKFAPVINEIKLVEPEILYEVSAAGKNNFEGLGKANKEPESQDPKKDTTQVLGSPAALALKAFVLENGRLRFKDLKNGRQLNLERINQAVSLDLDQRLENINTQGKLEILGIKVSDSASGVRTGDIRITVLHDIHINLPAEKVQVKKLELGFQDIRMQLKGEASHFLTKPPALDFQLMAHDIHLASILKEIPVNLSPDLPKIKVAGIAALDAHMQGVLEPGKMPNLVAHFSLRDGALNHKDLPAGITDLNMDLQVNGDSVNLSRFGFDLGGNPVKMDALITSIQSQVPILNSFNINALLDLGKLIPLAKGLALAEPDLQGSGTIQTVLSARGPLDPKAPQNLQAQGQIDLNDVLLEAKAIPKPLKLKGQIKVNNEKILESLAIQFGASDLSISGSVVNYLAMIMPKVANNQKTKVKVSIQSAFLNLDELMPTGKKQEEKEAPPMTAFPALPKIDAEVDVKLARTQLMNLDLTQYSSRSTLTSGILTSAMKGMLYSGSFTTSMRADLKDTSNADIAFKLDVLKVEANDFISRLNDRLPLSNRLMKSLAHADSTIFGKFNLNMDIKTRGLPQTLADNLTGKINFGIQDGKLMETGLVKGLANALGKFNKTLSFREFKFSNFKTDMEALNGKLLIKDCQINESVVGALAAVGALGFDNTLNLSLENRLPPGLSQAVTGAGSALFSELAKLSKTPALAGASLVPVDKAGRAIVYFLIGGTLASPSFSLDTKRMSKEAGTGVKNAMAEALNKKKDEAMAKINEEKAKLETEAKARLESEKQKVTEEAKKQGKKVLKGLGF